MNEALKRPYEISVWQDALMTVEVPGETEEEIKIINYYQEQKVMIIGSDRMTSPNRIFNPVLTENINGEIILTFSLLYRYYDPILEEFVTNPFAPYLINERKIKLFYDNKWYDFIIKECEENSDEYTFNYTAYNQFALELGKVGYNLTFSTELNNNQGSITELAEKVLESTDWVVDKKNSDIIKQKIKESVYKAKVVGPITVLNVDTNEEVQLQNDENAEDITIYIFYSYVANNKTDFVQFILERDRPNYILDSDGVVTSTNYRFLHNVEFNFSSDSDEENNTIDVSNINEENQIQIINIIEIYNEFQAKRLVYGQRVVYDPIMERTVDLYKYKHKNGEDYIYHYIDYQYTTSEVITPYVTNGSDFNIFTNGSLQGWSNAVSTSEKREGLSVLQPISLVTYPEISSANVLSKIENFSKIRAYLELKYAALSNIETGENFYFNSGFEDNIVNIDHIASGESYLLRLRYLISDEQHGTLVPYTASGTKQGLRAIVAQYELKKEEFYKGEVKETLYTHKILPGTLLFDFSEGNFSVLNNVISEGHFENEFSSYIIDDVVQTPSSKYCYTQEGDENIYIWDADVQKYRVKTNNDPDYYYTTAKANYSISNNSLTDGTVKLGIFLSVEDAALQNKYIYVDDFQITKYILDATNVPITIGNVPSARSVETDYYYLKPNERMKKEQVNIYSSLHDLSYETGINEKYIEPVYNENCEKILSIEESCSNCFNILQTLCETFECWLKLKVLHNDDGTLVLDENYNPYKQVVFKEFIGKENFAGFKYGINLNSITRSIDSNEFVTKLIVDTVANENVNGGTLSIQNATTNPSNESYILDFSYYVNKGLITNKDDLNNDLNHFYESIKEVNEEIRILNQEKIDLEKALVELAAKRSVYDSLISEAKKNYTKALEKFEKVTKINYFEYVKRVRDEDPTLDDYVDNSTVVELIGDIYTYSTTIDNNVGLLSNINIEYNKIKLQLDGARDYSIRISTEVFEEEHTDNNELEENEVINRYQTQVIVDDYLDKFNFSLATSGNSEHESIVTFKSNANNRIFIVSNELEPYTALVINELPSNYNIQYYINNKPYIVNQDYIKQFYFRIYDKNLDNSMIKVLTLIPTEDYKQTYYGINNKINDILKEKEAIEKEFYKKYSRFIQEGTWSSSDYIDPELYYFDALQVSRVSSQPKVSYTITVSEVSELEGLELYKFAVGDKTYIEDGDFFGYIYTEYSPVNGGSGKIYKTPISEEVIISEVEWHLDKPEDNTITVQNYKTQFEDLFQRISATVQTLQYNETTYPKISSVLGSNGLIDKDLLRMSWNEAGTVGYNLTSTGAISTDEDGIMIQDLTNTANRIRLESRGIKTSTDGGQTWLNVIDGYGINADAINAGIINTQQIWLLDGDNPSFRWDKAGISAYGFNDNEEEPYDLKTYVRFDKYGLYGIQNGENYIASSLDDIKDTAKFGLTWDGFFIKNSYTDGYVSISSNDDFQVVSTNINRDITFEEPIEKDIQRSTVDGTIILPSSEIEVDKVVIVVEDAIVNEAIVNQNVAGGDTETLVDFTVNNNILTITDFIIDESPSTYQITYHLPKNKIDIGGDGILKINSVSIDENLVDNYNYIKEEGIIVFTNQLSPGSHISISYQLEHIKIGALDFVDGAPTKYGIKVKNNDGETVFETNDEGNLTVTGTIYARDGVFNGTVYATDGEFNGHIRATSGEFPGNIVVGNGSDKYIIIDGERPQPIIASSDYIQNSNHGWVISADGEATFNNVSVRGAIKTSVFEYSEIQAVGGAFLFRPSVVIKKAKIIGNDLMLILEQAGFFRVGDWCKLDKYTVAVEDSLENAGLAAIYQVISKSEDGRTVVLEGAAELFE